MKLIRVSVALLEDTKGFLSQISPEVYSQPVELLSGSSIGQHTRHYIEFFQCLLYKAQECHCEVNYDLRKRDKRIEQSPSFAGQVIDELIGILEGLDLPGIKATVAAAYGEGPEVCVESNLPRELMYNIEHTIHHLAIIKIGLRLVAPEVSLPPNFGVAASTISYRNGVNANA